MKLFAVIIITDDDATEEDIKDIVSHFDGETEVETTKGKIVVPCVETVKQYSPQ